MMRALARIAGGVIVWGVVASQTPWAGAAATGEGRAAPGSRPTQTAKTADTDAMVRQLRQHNAALLAQVAALQAQLRAAPRRVPADRQAVQQSLDRLSRAMETAVGNEKAARADVERIRRDLDDLKRRQAGHAKHAKLLNEELADVKYRFALLQKRNRQLDEQLRKQAEQTRHTESRGAPAAGAGPAPPGARKIAPASKVKVSGLLRRVDHKNNLVLISIGSDDGVRAKQQMVVFRGDASRPRLLGTIEIVAVSPDQAVGRISNQIRAEAFRVGDTVAQQADMPK